MTADPASPAETASMPASRPRWVHALPVLVLVIAIIGQGTLMATANIDRQTGSGFAMFSSVDFAGSRSVVVTATLDGEPVTVDLPSMFDDQVDDLLYAPTNTRAGELAAQLAQLNWSEQDGLVSVDQTASRVGGIDSVQVTVRGLTADGHTLGSEILAIGTAA